MPVDQGARAFLYGVGSGIGSVDWEIERDTRRRDHEQNVPVSFGALGVLVIALATVTGYSLQELSAPSRTSWRSSHYCHLVF